MQHRVASSRAARARARVAGCAVAAIAAFAGPAAALDPFVHAYGDSAAGQSACATFGSTQQIDDFFPGGGTVTISQPKGVACGVGEDLHENDGPSGGVAAASTLSVGFGTGGDPKTYSRGEAAFGLLGAEARGTYTGTTDSFTVDGSEAFAVFRDTFTIGVAPAYAGTPGVLRMEFTVSGAASLTGRGDSYFGLFHTANAGPQYLVYRVQMDTSNTSVYLNGDYVTQPDQAPDLIILPGSVSVSAKPCSITTWSSASRSTSR